MQTLKDNYIYTLLCFRCKGIYVNNIERLIYDHLMKPDIDDKYYIINNRLYNTNNEVAVMVSRDHKWSTHPNLTFKQKEEFLFSYKLALFLLNFPRADSSHGGDQSYNEYFRTFISEHSDVKYLEDFLIRTNVVNLPIIWVSTNRKFKVVADGFFKSIEKIEYVDQNIFQT